MTHSWWSIKSSQLMVWGTKLSLPSTGYIPGMRYHFGTTFRKAADECADELCKRILAEDSKRTLDHALRPLSPIISIRAKDTVNMALHGSHEQLKYKGETIITIYFISTKRCMFVCVQWFLILIIVI